MPLVVADPAAVRRLLTRPRRNTRTTGQFSLDEWGRGVAANDGDGRFRFGIPPRTKGDLAFVQHMGGVLTAAGRLGVVMPHGVLFRGSAEGKCCHTFLPQELQRDAVALARAVDVRAVGPRPVAHRRDPGEQLGLEGGVVELGRQRPAHPPGPSAAGTA